MKTSVKLGVFLILVIAMSISLFGCGAKIEENINEADAEIEKLFEIEQISTGYRVKKYKGTVGDVTIPSTYKGGKVTEIGEWAFSGSKIEKITVPSTVEKIGKGAFSTCYDLKTVTLNEGLKEIEDSAFSQDNIEKIIIPSSVEKMGCYVFVSCYKLKAIYCRAERVKDAWNSEWHYNSLSFAHRIVWGYTGK